MRIYCPKVSVATMPNKTPSASGPASRKPLYSAETATPIAVRVNVAWRHSRSTNSPVRMLATNAATNTSSGASAGNPPTMWSSLSVISGSNSFIKIFESIRLQITQSTHHQLNQRQYRRIDFIQGQGRVYSQEQREHQHGHHDGRFTRRSIAQRLAPCGTSFQAGLTEEHPLQCPQEVRRAKQDAQRAGDGHPAR